MVVPLSMSPEAKKNRIEEEVLSYAKQYRKFIEKNKTEVKSSESDKLLWLWEAGNAACDENSKSFYHTLRHELETLHISSPPNPPTGKNCPISKLDFPNAVWNECDKGLGISLILSQDMKTAEDAMIKELDGSKLPRSKEELLSSLQI